MADVVRSAGPPLFTARRAYPTRRRPGPQPITQAKPATPSRALPPNGVGGRRQARHHDGNDDQQSNDLRGAIALQEGECQQRSQSRVERR